jgi:hypothetical protein
MCVGSLPDPLNIHKPKSRGGMGLPDPLGLFDSKEADKEAPAPAVVRESPKADAVAAETDAAQKAATTKLATQRRRRGLSLLASGSGGDTSSPMTATPAAVGKPTLGA